MPIINITVADKHATLVGTPVIVCDNTDYSVQFTFDAEWGTDTLKTARFAWVADGKRQHTDVIFTGDTVVVPILADIWEVYVGVFEGDLSTTTPARIYCERSIRSHSGQPAEEYPGQYDHIMALFQQAVDQQAQAAEDAQTAQDAAQRAENAAVNVEAIVAGNEAYTKQENDSRDAPAIVESATGAAIVVEDAADRPLHSLVLHGKATQAKTTGAQLFDIASTVADAEYFDPEGVVSHSPTIKVTEIVTAPATAYTVSDMVGGAYVRVAYLTADGTYIDRLLIGTGAGVATFTTPAGCYKLQIAIDSDVSQAMIAAGSTAQAWEPYSAGYASPSPEWPQAVESPSGTLGVKVCGKNILHYPYSEGSMTRQGITFTVNEDGTVTVTGTSTGSYIALITKAEEQIYLCAGKTYTFSGVPAGGGLDTYYAYVATGQETFFDTGTGVTLTPKTSGYVSVTAVIKDGITMNGEKFKPQLEIGSTVTDFEAYQAQELSYELPGKFCAGMLDGLTGELNYGTIIDIEADEWGPGRGASGWIDGFESVGKETIAFHHHLGAEKENYYPATLCSHFPAAASWAEIVSASTEMAYRGNSNGLAYAAVRIKRSRLIEYGFVDDGTGETAAAAFTAWLEAQAAAGTPVQFVGEIENTAQLVGAVSANTYKLTTTVLNDAGLDMDLEYVADTKAYISKTYPSFEGVAF